MITSTEVSDMSVIVDCICTRCGTTGSYHRRLSADDNIPVCAFCGIKMRDVFDVARECVREKIAAREEDQ